MSKRKGLMGRDAMEFRLAGYTAVMKALILFGLFVGLLSLVLSGCGDAVPNEELEARWEERGEISTDERLLSLIERLVTIVNDNQERLTALEKKTVRHR